MTSKRELLMAICETPGWTPPEDSSSIDRSLSELRGEGWIAPRLDGFEATPRALDAYPTFLGHADLVDPRATSLRVLADDGPAPPVHSRAGCVPVTRVADLIAGLLYEMPMSKVIALSERSFNPPYPEVAKLANEIAQRMAG